MNRHHIDLISRQLAAGVGRRALVGGLVAAWLSTRRDVAAGCTKVGKKCDKNKDCCDHAECKGGECKCRSGFDDCGGKCVKLDNDEKHCGGCDVRCDAGDRCIDGACVQVCPQGADSCSGEGTIRCFDRSTCHCLQSTEGETICGDITTASLCGACDTSADCAEFGAGAVCAVAGSNPICCGPDARNFCLLPCSP